MDHRPQPQKQTPRPLRDSIVTYVISVGVLMATAVAAWSSSAGA